PGAYVSVLQSSTVLPAPPVASNLPSGENATVFTFVEWSSVVLRKSGIVQIFTVSPPAEASDCPSGEKARQVTGPSWALTLFRSWPRASPQKPTLPSLPPVARLRPSLLAATKVIFGEFPGYA